LLKLFLKIATLFIATFRRKKKQNLLRLERKVVN